LVSAFFFSLSSCMSSGFRHSLLSCIFLRFIRVYNYTCIRVYMFCKRAVYTVRISDYHMACQGHPSQDSVYTCIRVYITMYISFEYVYYRRIGIIRVLRAIRVLRDSDNSVHFQNAPTDSRKPTAIFSANLLDIYWKSIVVSMGSCLKIYLHSDIISV